MNHLESQKMKVNDIINQAAKLAAMNHLWATPRGCGHKAVKLKETLDEAWQETFPVIGWLVKDFHPKLTSTRHLRRLYNKAFKSAYITYSLDRNRGHFDKQSESGTFNLVEISTMTTVVKDAEPNLQNIYRHLVQLLTVLAYNVIRANPDLYVLGDVNDAAFNIMQAVKLNLFSNYFVLVERDKFDTHMKIHMYLLNVLEAFYNSPGLRDFVKLLRLRDALG